MEQDKGKIIAEEYEYKVLHDIFEDPLEEDEYLQTIINNEELKNKIEQILNGIENEEQGGVEQAINQLLTSLLEEINNQFPSEQNRLNQYKPKLASKISSLKLLLLMKKPNTKTHLEKVSNKNQQSKEIHIQQHIKNLLKRFVIYEIYKIMNPKRIAGETKVANFINNMITGGLKRAMKYEGGRKRDLTKYSPKMIKTLNQYHNKFKKTPSRGLQI